MGLRAHTSVRLPRLVSQGRTHRIILAASRIQLLTQQPGFRRVLDVEGNRPISVYRLGKMPIQSCRQSVSAPRGKAGARLNSHTQMRGQSVSAQRGKRGTEIVLLSRWRALLRCT